jgi:hypothetical protein
MPSGFLVFVVVVPDKLPMELAETMADSEQSDSINRC